MKELFQFMDVTIVQLEITVGHALIAAMYIGIGCAIAATVRDEIKRLRKQ